MTLTELKYIVAAAWERHFRHAAEACFVSQPTLLVAIKKLEDELVVQIFERDASEVSVTPVGEQIVTQAQRVLEETMATREIAKQGMDLLVGSSRLRVIYTIGPYLLPVLIKQMIDTVPQMPLMLQENFTVRLVELLKQGEVDCVIMVGPFPETGLMTMPLYDGPSAMVVPRGYELAKAPSVGPAALKQQTILLPGNGHCLRDHVLGVCPELSHFSQNADGIQKTFEGSSLETIRHMVASDVSITVLPHTSVSNMQPAATDLLTYMPFHEPVPDRRIVLVWRKSFTRITVTEVMAKTVAQCNLPSIKLLPPTPLVH